MSKHKILYICQEITPYLPETTMSNICRFLPQVMQENGSEIRLFTPRYGVINERRGQLHEVIRLSGMNIIIDNSDHQLILKVASITGARLQVYFIDNDDYFKRKAFLNDENGAFFADNDERAIFFARGVLETVKKLRWAPTVIHCHGWMSAIIPAYVKHVFKDDPIFASCKIVISSYADDKFNNQLNKNIAKKLIDEGINKNSTAVLADPTYENLIKFTLQYANALVEIGEPMGDLKQIAEKNNIKYLNHTADEVDYQPLYAQLYESISE